MYIFTNIPRLHGSGACLQGKFCFEKRSYKTLSRFLKIADRFEYRSDQARAAFAKLNYNAGKFGRSFELIEKTPNTDEDLDSSLLRLDIYLDALKFDKFAKLAEELKSNHPDNVDLALRLANGHYRLGHHDLALNILGGIFTCW